MVFQDDLTPRKRAKVGLKVTQTSSLHDLMYVISSLGLNYHDDEDHVWEEPVGPEVHLSNASAFWKRESCEALSRTTNEKCGNVQTIRLFVQ